MPPQLIVEDEEEDYASSEDSDFAPDEAPEQEGDGIDSDASSENEQDDHDGTTTTATARKKRKHKDGQKQQQGAEDDAGFENSGDEAIIEKGKRKKNKKRRKGDKALDDEEDEAGAEGGLIKTRSMRALEKAERKAHVATGPVTVDVDALWASMTAAPIIPSIQEQQPDDSQTTCTDADGTGAPPQDGKAKDTAPDEMIKIKRTYNFAGKVHTEEKLVARDSAEARLYLASKKTSDPNAPNANGDNEGADDDDDQPDKRMPRKAFRSAFEPVLLTDGQQRTDLNLAIAMRLQAREKAKKLNTVEKSRMDWAGFVDKEGIKDDLVLAGKAKGSYADRQDFLARTEARREDDARRVRLAGKA
ncbi:bucentaur or craniofacial development-domain-containing protein [Coniella lustricola]|uniref:SWR1-complex protein 5 n=1 Tax=Coniella lustricola TaxID=2025994 RepID=A0A2T3AFB3_9PEZI|nr:bucentaur or craniofacial development-domain-containing protein [Coniella lustricola]